jgi:hypothetical protein
MHLQEYPQQLDMPCLVSIQTQQQTQAMIQ